MGRVWEQPWLESEVRLGPRRARPRAGSGPFSPQISQSQCGQRGAPRTFTCTRICTPESVQTPSCGWKGNHLSPAQHLLGRKLRLGCWGSGQGEERERQGEGNLSRQAGGPVSGWGQVSGWDKARLKGSAHPGLRPGHTCAGPAGHQPQGLRRHHYLEAGQGPGLGPALPGTLRVGLGTGPWSWHGGCPGHPGVARPAPPTLPSGWGSSHTRQAGGGGVDGWKSGGSGQQEGSGWQRGTGMMPLRLTWCSWPPAHQRGTCL